MYMSLGALPAYVLDKSIQDGKKIPRWKPRSDRRIYVGVSPNHASTVGLCLNLTTGAISPQYHVVYDDQFATVTSTPADLSMLTTPEWLHLFGDSAYQYVQEEPDVDDQAPNPQLESMLAQQDKVAAAMTQTPDPYSNPRTNLAEPPDNGTGPPVTNQPPSTRLEPVNSASTPSLASVHPPPTPPVREPTPIKATPALREQGDLGFEGASAEGEATKCDPSSLFESHFFQPWLTSH